MGLTTTHNCWDGSCTSFNDWRRCLCEAAGYGDLDNYLGFGGDKAWPESDILIVLLNHSDCDGEIEWTDCIKLADRLFYMLPDMTYTLATKRFIDGLRLAAAAKENVIFT